MFTSKDWIANVTISGFSGKNTFQWEDLPETLIITLSQMLALSITMRLSSVSR